MFWCDHNHHSDARSGRNSRLAADQRIDVVKPSTVSRRYPVGAEIIARGETHFRLWAPKARRVDLVLEDDAGGESKRAFQRLRAERNGYFSGTAAVGAGARYRFRVDHSENFYPDPASRYQPNGPHGSSLVIDAGAFRWSDQKWPGLKLKGQIIYELHVGTFTPEGTWAAATRQLRELSRTGISVIEMMPVAEFPGEFGWGYDGVDLFAPYHGYGRPDDLRAFVDVAHSLGIGVILDVVYNHFGPDGNYLTVFSDAYFTDRYETDWGTPINFDGPDSGPVREFFITNARYWITEFHFDGFRFDATQSIFDESEEHILAAIGKAARAAAGKRSIIMVAENEPQETKLIRSLDDGGCGLDAMWNDDLHHSAIVALTGRHPAYYTDYRGTPQEFISAVKHGFLYQGQHYSWQKQRRGTPGLGFAPQALVGFLENHDQVANSAAGDRVRLTTSPGRYRALVTLLLLAPWTPMLFQGQEFGATTPFLYFADVPEELREPVRKGRLEFLSQFPELATTRAQRKIADPSDPTTFQRCKLDFSERRKHREIAALCRDLIRLRRSDRNFSRQEPGKVDGAVLGPRAFVLRYLDPAGDDRLLVVNLGPVLPLEVAPEPLLGPPGRGGWRTLWSSEATRYGGAGEVAVESKTGWRLPAEAAVVLRPSRSA